MLSFGPAQNNLYVLLKGKAKDKGFPVACVARAVASLQFLSVCVPVCKVTAAPIDRINKVRMHKAVRINLQSSWVLFLTPQIPFYIFLFGVGVGQALFLSIKEAALLGLS